MPAPDDFSSYIGELLGGSYDCVDRIVLRAYYPMGQTSGGFLTWWNDLNPNTALSQEHLRRMAGDFSRRVRALSGSPAVDLLGQGRQLFCRRFRSCRVSGQGTGSSVANQKESQGSSVAKPP